MSELAECHYAIRLFLNTVTVFGPCHGFPGTESAVSF